uniref:Uncharacterized protein n=1 Tax=Solanum lycopersicum TaxID=4081 RepID=K4B4D9_SOLLC
MVFKIVCDKAVNQLEKALNSKLEATIAIQIQALFEHVNSTFNKVIVDHTGATQQQFDSVNSPLAIAPRDAINPALAMTQTTSREFTDSQRQLLSLIVSGGNFQSTNQLNHINNGSLLHQKIETPPDPTKEISRKLGEH